MAFFILPNQLFEVLENYKSHSHRNEKFFIIEEPVYFYDEKYKPFYCNKVKVAFLRAAMKCFYKSLVDETSKNQVQYIQYADVPAFYKKCLYDKTPIKLYDPCDHDLMQKFKDIGLHQNMTVLETPSFIHSTTVLNDYVQSCKNRPKHATFYEFSKKKLGKLVAVLDGVKNLDQQNRARPPKDDFMKNVQLFIYHPPSKLERFYKEAIEYTTEFFDQEYRVGNVNNCKLYPITSQESYQYFENFLQNRFIHFGKYQDAIMKEHTHMFHSVISPMLNCGLMNPFKVVKMIVDFWQKNKKLVPMSSLEGLLRQLIGWREYERMLYVYWGQDMIVSNLPQNNNRIQLWTAWYKGTTGVLPLDTEIKKAVGCGYSHHIVRLMIFMNFMILCGLSPAEIYKWFMEVVSIDAYSWVMVSNIWTMGYFWKNAMTKPYLSSSNYILTMSDYKKDGHWDVLWNGLYKKFIIEKPNEYVFFYKRTINNTKSLDSNEQKLVSDFLNKMTKFLSI